MQRKFWKKAHGEGCNLTQRHRTVRLLWLSISILHAESTPPNREHIKNLANELANERNRAAAERTLMAWIRTRLSLISFGVGIDGIISSIYIAIGGRERPVGVTRFTGMALVVLGTVARN